MGGREKTKRNEEGERKKLERGEGKREGERESLSDSRKATIF